MGYAESVRSRLSLGGPVEVSYFTEQESTRFSGCS